MVGSERKPQAEQHVRHALEVSERRACTTIEQPRFTQCCRGRKGEKDATLAPELRRISRERPRAGYRMAPALQRREGMLVNKKGVLRVWRQEGPRVVRRQ